MAPPRLVDHCFADGHWSDSACGKCGAECASNCALEGVTESDWTKTYGVSQRPGGVSVNFKTGDKEAMFEAGGREEIEMFKAGDQENIIELKELDGVVNPHHDESLRVDRQQGGRGRSSPR